MTIAMMIAMNASSKINKGTADDVCSALSEKYGESFVAVRIGDRFNTNSAKLYVHPESNHDLRFTARINQKTGVVEDDYIEEKVNYQVEKMIAKSFSERGINVSSRSMIVTKEPICAEVGDYTPVEFQEKYQFEQYTLYLVIEDGNFSALDVISAIKSANETIGVKLVILGYVFEASQYLNCVEELQEIPEMSSTMIKAHSPVSMFGINVAHGECSITESELSDKMGRP